jgi:GntP family gluconate:H+ symporter
MTGVPFLIVFVLAIAAMIVLISRLKVHPFFSIMGISLVLAILAGIPLRQIPGVIGSGFSATFTSIGIVIVLGAFIGAVLEKTGAALKLADMVIRLVGEKHPDLAMELMGWVVSVPVFCDSGFVILDPVRKSLARRTGASSVALTVCLSCGLYISHVFIPPTPGPIAAAQTLGVGENLLMVMGLGVVCSIFPLIAGYIFARYIGPKVTTTDITSDGSGALTYEELKSSFGKLPSAMGSLAPIIVPILLMALSSVVSMAHWEGMTADLCVFFGSPIIALSVGAVLAIILLYRTGQGKIFFKLSDDTLKSVGPILFVTAAGSVLGKVIASSDLVNYITSHASVMQSMGIVFPFLLAAILKSAQGSSTVAITTTAGLIAPLLPALGLVTPAEVSLAVMAIGAGAMTVSHANDSYFWVVTRFGGLDVGDGYRTQTMMTFIIGMASMVEIFLLKLVIV